MKNSLKIMALLVLGVLIVPVWSAEEQIETSTVIGIPSDNDKPNTNVAYAFATLKLTLCPVGYLGLLSGLIIAGSGLYDLNAYNTFFGIGIGATSFFGVGLIGYLADYAVEYVYNKKTLYKANCICSENLHTIAFL